MSFPRAKPVQQLYDEVAHHDLVVVPDAPLASALNRRLDRPHVGPFAITPRRLAAGRREEAEDRTAFLEIVKNNDIEWKRAAYAIGNILQCWEHQGRMDAVLEYEAYADDATRLAVDHIGDLLTTSSNLTEYRIPSSTDIGVVGYEQLTNLERSILPEEYETYDPFTDGEFDYPSFHIFDSSTAIVETVVEKLSPENADDVAVVLDQGSEYSALVESALEAADIPFYGGPGFIDDTDHRTFIQLLRAAHTGSDTQIRELRPLLSYLDATVPITHDEERLSEVDLPELDWITTFCEELEQGSFKQALDAFEAETNCSLDRFREELAALSIADATPTEKAVDRLMFYLQTYEVPVDRENEGVLLADAKSAAYVRRPVVFYLGLDEGWTHSAPKRPWVDREEQYRRNFQQFQQLLQSGTEQYYLVQDSNGGTPVTPCLYFEELLDAEFDRFSDLLSQQYTRHRDQTGAGFERSSVDVEPEEVTTISQSSLSTYVNSPRDHFFSRLVDGPDKDYFREGSLFHDFAEFYVNHPKFVDDDTRQEVVEIMLEEARSLLRSVDEATRRTKYEAGVETIVSFFDENQPDPATFLTGTSGWGNNTFEEYFDRPVDSSITERWFKNEELGLKGKIDLVHAPTCLLDYKSGNKKSAKDVVRNSALDPPSDTPNYQALLYLTHWRSQQPNQPLEFTFFHFLETLDDLVTGTAAIEDTLTTVSYRPVSFKKYVESEAFFNELVRDGSNDCQKTLSQVGYEDYRAVFGEAAPPATSDSDELIESPFGARFIERMRDRVGEYKYVKNGCKQVMREMARVQGRNYFKEDLDQFEVFIEEHLAELNHHRAGGERVPIEGPGGEPNYRYVDNRDLLLEGDR